MRTVVVALLVLAGGCGPKSEPAATSGVWPAPIHQAMAALEDPLADAARMRVAVRMVRPSEEKSTAEWTGWVPLDGAKDPGADADALGDLEMIVAMIRPRALLEDVLIARPYRWVREGAAYRGTVEGGGYVSVRFDDRKRIAFVRSNATGHPTALDLRYDARTNWVSEIDAHDDDLELGLRWSRREGGLFDLDVGAAQGGAAGEIHVRVLEVEKSAKAP